MTSGLPDLYLLGLLRRRSWNVEAAANLAMEDDINRVTFTVGQRLQVLYDDEWFDATVIKIVPVGIRVQFDEDQSKLSILRENFETDVRLPGDFPDNLKSTLEDSAMQQEMKVTAGKGANSDDESSSDEDIPIVELLSRERSEKMPSSSTGRKKTAAKSSSSAAKRKSRELKGHEKSRERAVKCQRTDAKKIARARVADSAVTKTMKSK